MMHWGTAKLFANLGEHFTAFFSLLGARTNFYEFMGIQCEIDFFDHGWR